MTTLAELPLTTADHLPSPARRRPRTSPRPSPLAPLRTVEPSEHSQRLALRGWVECPRCQKTFVRGAVVIEPQAPLTEPLCGYIGPVHQVKLYCDHCDAVVIRLRTGEAGQPSHQGEWLGNYGLLRDSKKIAAFLTAHPEAKGVLQS